MLNWTREKPKLMKILPRTDMERLYVSITNWLKPDRGGSWWEMRAGPLGMVRSKYVSLIPFHVMNYMMNQVDNVTEPRRFRMDTSCGTPGVWRIRMLSGQ